MIYFFYCPRCATQAYERLSTHSYCAACDYSPVFDEVKEELETLEGTLKHITVETRASLQLGPKSTGHFLSACPLPNI